MTRLPRHLVQEAKDEADQWEKFKDSASFAAAGVVPVITQVAGPPVGAICGAAAASMIMLGSHKSRLARRKAEDPPDRDNYRRRVVARRGHFNKDAFGPAPLERATVRAADGMLWAMAFESAMVRADERAAGAQEMGEPDVAADRLAEARLYALSAAEANVAAERACIDLASELRRVDVGREPFDPRGMPPRLDEALPDQTLVILFRAGFRIEDLRIALPSRIAAPDDPIGLIGDELEAAARSSGRFGRELAAAADVAYGANPA